MFRWASSQLFSLYKYPLCNRSMCIHMSLVMLMMIFVNFFVFFYTRTFYIAPINIFRAINIYVMSLTTPTSLAMPELVKCLWIIWMLIACDSMTSVFLNVYFSLHNAKNGLKKKKHFLKTCLFSALVSKAMSSKL